MGKEGKKRSNSKGILIILGLMFSIFIVNTVSPTELVDLSTDVTNYFIETTKGNVAGQISGNKFGQNLVVGTSFEDIQSQGGTLIILQSAELISIIYSDTTKDILTGANATSVLIEGLDENFESISEIVNLSATATNTTNEYIRVNKMIVNEVGNYSSSNAGTISGTAILSNTVQIEIPIGEGQSKSTHFTVPAGKNLIITAFRITMDTGKTIDIVFKFRENANDITAPMSPIKTIRDVRGIDTAVSGVSLGNLKFGEKTDIWAKGLTSVGTSQIEVNFDFIQYDI